MLNHVILMGRLTSDPEFKATPSGVTVSKFTLAVPRSYIKQGEERQTDFIYCTAFRSTAEFVNKWFTKGRQIIVEGSLQSRSWEDKDGNKRSALDVIVDNTYFCDKKDKPDEEQQYLHDERKGMETSDSEFMMPIAEEDMPF